MIRSGGRRGIGRVAEAERTLRIDLHGGRSSVSGVVATVFGASGFLGRYVVGRLGRVGSQVVVPYRGDDLSIRFAKVMGDLGQIVPAWFDVRDKDSLRNVMQHSNVVINFIGKHWATRNFSFYDTNVVNAANIAAIAKQVGVERLIHISSEGASLDSPSDFAVSKALGEQAVRDNFPEATIVRPTIVYGREDNFINKFGKWNRVMPFFPVLFPGRTIQPLFASDVATAIMTILSRTDTVGKTMSIGGPRIYSYEDIYDLIQDETYFHKTRVKIPFQVASSFVKMWEMWPDPSLVEDELIYLSNHDLVIPAGKANAMQELGIAQSGLEEWARSHLRLYRKRDYVTLVD